MAKQFNNITSYIPKFSDIDVSSSLSRDEPRYTCNEISLIFQNHKKDEEFVYKVNRSRKCDEFIGRVKQNKFCNIVTYIDNKCYLSLYMRRSCFDDNYVDEDIEVNENRMIIGI